MRLHLGVRAKRGGALVIGTVLALTSGAAIITPAQAAVANVGRLTFAPATGTNFTPIQLTTVSKGPNTGCPAGSEAVFGVANGPGAWTNIPVVGNDSSQVSTTSEFSEGLSDTFQGIATSNGLTITAGRYDISLKCQDSLGTQIFGTFDSPIFFTDATHYQSTDPNAVTTTTTVSASPASPQASGTSVTFTATVTGAGAAGTVQFKDGGTNLGAAQTLASTHASVTTSALTVGSHSITAVFTPTNSSAFTASTSTPITYVINAAPVTTTTSVSASPASPQVSGTSVTFTATVTGAGAAGTVQFKDGGTNLGTAQTLASTHASVTMSALTVGSHSITAVFTPTNSSAFTASTSTPITYVINAAPVTTTTSVSASPASPQVSEPP
jgi:hypothetical protein